MSGERQEIGTILWRDVTVEKADELRAFYESVVGWKSSAVEMDGYSDFSMSAPESGEDVAGICHARGPNTDLPPQWLMYVVVANIQASAKHCVELGGEVVTGPRAMGGGMLCVIRDPQGAVCALYEQPPAEP